MEKEREQNIIFNIIAVLCIIFLCVSISPKTLQNDTFYTIKIGEYIFQNGISDLTKDVYSWHDWPYTYPHWRYDLGMFLIYDNFGHLVIYISTMLFATYKTMSPVLKISLFILYLHTDNIDNFILFVK